MTRGYFPWPAFFMFAAMIVMAVIMMARFGIGRNGPCPTGSVGPTLVAPADRARPRAVEEPLIILRERMACGEIDLPEFERRVEGLLRSEPKEQVPSWDK